MTEGEHEDEPRPGEEDFIVADWRWDLGYLETVLASTGELRPAWLDPAWELIRRAEADGVEFLSGDYIGDVLNPYDMLDLEPSRSVVKPAPLYKTCSHYYQQAPQDLRDLFVALERYLICLGEDVQRKTRKHYWAYRRIGIFACVEIHPRSEKLLVYLKVNPDDVALEEGFTRDVRTIEHFGTGDLEVTIKSLADLEKAKPLVLISYEGS